MEPQVEMLQGGSSIPTKIHPSLKMLLFLFLSMLPFVFQAPYVQLTLFLCNLLLVTYLGWKRSLFFLYLVLGIIGGVLTGILWLPFIHEGVVLVRWQLPVGMYELTITDIGVAWAFGMGLRIMNIVLLSIFYFYTTSSRQLVIALRGIGMPFSISYLLSLVIRFIPMLKHDLQVIKEAQMVRGLQFEEGNWKEKLKNYSRLFVPLIINTLKRVQLMANALDSKGFRFRNKQHRFYRSPGWRTHEWLGALLMLVIFAALVYVARIHPSHFGILLDYRV